MGGLFDTFTVAKRGLAVQQGNINTSSHNIANAQTEGYSRQRNTVQTTRPFGGMSRFDSCSVGQVGTGAEITQIMRVRDSFLDYQVRTETTNSGTCNVKSQYLYEVEDILNETTSNGIQGALSQFYNAFQELSKTPSSTSQRTTAMAKASALADAISSRYKQLETEKSDAQQELSQYTTDINDTLDKINQLNKQIASIATAGMTPNDLMDSRDLLIDQLSSKFGIKITKQARETIDLSASEDTNGVVGNLVNSNPNDMNYNRFSYVEGAEIKGAAGSEYLEVTYNVLGNKDNQNKITIPVGGGTTLDDLKSLQSNLLEDRILVADKDGNVVSSSSATTTAATIPGDVDGTVETLAPDGTGTIVTKKVSGGVTTTTTVTKTAINTADALKKQLFNGESSGITKGEVAGNQQVQDTIQNYMDELDKFAASLAYSVNAIQTGDNGDGTGGVTDADGNKHTDCIFVVKLDDGTVTTDDTGINAKNIAINSALDPDNIADNPGLLNCGVQHVDDISGEKDGSRALAIADLKNLKINIGGLTDDDISSRYAFFNGTSGLGNAGVKYADSNNMELTNANGGTGTALSDYYSATIVVKVGSDSQSAQGDVATQTNKLQSLENQRLSVSGVSLDEEMADLIQFQHSYQANAKIISTVDELLDVVINGLKR